MAQARHARWGGKVLGPTPNLDKMLAVHEESQAIGEFIEWLKGNGYVIGRWAKTDWRDRGDHSFHPEQHSINEWLAKYYDLDLDEMERERGHVLDHVREMNE